MNPYLAALIMALVAYLPRVLPVTIFQKPIKSRFVRSFLYYVPFTVLSAMTFPDIFYCSTTRLSAIIGTAIALLLSFWERGLVVVATGAVVGVYLTELLLKYF